MELFDKKFVYLEWDDVLEGKKVFLGDTLPQLRVLVNGHCDSLQEVSKNVSDDSFYPFISPYGTRYAMVYYDPNYECKVAYAQSKTIQYKLKDSSDWWADCVVEPKWEDHCDYRVKPEKDKASGWEQVAVRKRRMTYREFAKWVAQGNGQVKNTNGCYITSRGVEYDIGDDDKPCQDDIVIRGWDETEWHAPEVEE